MASRIEEIEGIGPVYAQKLSAAGVTTDAQLLERAAAPKGRSKLAEETGISGALILKWANHADLMRINGVGPQFAELLEAAGVDTVNELSHRNAANLSARMALVNSEKKLSGASPSESQVSGWIEQARSMAPAISY